MVRKDACAVCGAVKGLVWHHYYYTSDDVRYTDFCQTAEGKRQYREAVDKLARSQPERFVRLCNRHHFTVEKMARFNDRNFRKLVRIANRTRKLQVVEAERMARLRDECDAMVKRLGAAP